MKPTPPHITRHSEASRHSSSPQESSLPKALPQRPQSPTERMERAPTKHTERAVARRLHRKLAAPYIGVSVGWLDKARLRGVGPPFLRVGTRVLYDTADLDTYLASCRRQSTSEPR